MLVSLLLFSITFFKLYEFCPLEYYATDPNHSYCLPPFSGVVDQAVSSSERQRILQMHNDERRLVRGTNIEKMYWNDDLAEIALRYARGCIFDHDNVSQRTVPRIPLSTGQNLAMGYENWTQAITGWIEEKEHYFHGYPSTSIVAHYTQMIWHSSVLVGCAATMCPPYGPYNIPWPFYVCNYVTGQLNSDIYRPYEQGSYDHPLHDCQGKVCVYNGTLDLNTCQCRCSTFASGVQCEHLNCSVLPPCPYYSTASCVAVNVPSECPQLCGLCERYEILKRVYGEHNLVSGTTIQKSTTTTTKATTIKTTKRTISRKLKQKLRNRTRIVSKKRLSTTLATTIIMSTSTQNHSFLPTLPIFSYLLQSFLIIIYLF